MGWRNTATGWGWPARLLHWTMAVLVPGMLALGFYTANIEQDLLARFTLIQWHKSFGFTVFVLALVRLAWRLANRAPALPPGTPRWQRRAAACSHAAIYVLLLAVPLAGWLAASASPLNDAGALPFRIPNMVFGLFEMPDPVAEGSEPLADALAGIHATLAYTLAALLVLHVAAALKHHLIDRDTVLRRMLTGG